MNKREPNQPQNLCAECGGTAIFCERDHLNLLRDGKCPVDLEDRE